MAREAGETLAQSTVARVPHRLPSLGTAAVELEPFREQQKSTIRAALA